MAEKKFVELVIESPFILFKGFLMGFMEGTGEKPVYFFSKKTGIKTETLVESLKVWFGFETLVHLCIEKDFAEKLKKALENTFDKLGMKVKSEKPIKSASFDFKVTFYHKSDAKKFEDLVHNLPEGVVLDEFKKEVDVDKEAKKEKGIYAVEHAYVYKAVGEIVGDFQGVIDVFLKMKDMPHVELEEVYLNFE
ncbi:hypothetical protein TTHT_0171 [Thermotomaculum hydrothermale]|uniref:Uncharacterized protein n=1 Tax=Thermotomaculum hydrothermale TaxID=981385 RepID=A0A7R6PFU5_9BACT|nr:hypothetical protein [Thermotomaculum hydrothermale]BBB31809.1 hypothetical protein TTHT_0171 [Thermotomaculum hydrothermale]